MYIEHNSINVRGYFITVHYMSKIFHALINECLYFVVTIAIQLLYITTTLHSIIIIIIYV